MQYNTIQYNTIQYNTIQYNTIQYNTVYSLCNTMQWGTPTLFFFLKKQKLSQFPRHVSQTRGRDISLYMTDLSYEQARGKQFFGSKGGVEPLTPPAYAPNPSL